MLVIAAATRSSWRRMAKGADRELRFPGHWPAEQDVSIPACLIDHCRLRSFMSFIANPPDRHVDGVLRSSVWGAWTGASRRECVARLKVHQRGLRLISTELAEPHRSAIALPGVSDIPHGCRERSGLVSQGPASPIRPLRLLHWVVRANVTLL